MKKNTNMKIRRKLLYLLLKILRLDKANRFSCSLAEIFSPCKHISYKGKDYIFYCPNNLTRWRAETYFTKEPETIEWINTFKESEILFDIGANIGLYSIYAAKRGISVIAFEPESQNYALINRNIYLNGCTNKIMCLNNALSEKDCLDYLYIPYFEAGRAINCFGQPIDWNYEKFTPAFKQGVISYTLDYFLSRFPDYFPTHIKIDVDGIEPKIVKGAEKTLRNEKLRSLSVEINESLSEHLEMVKIIQSAGLLLTQKKHSEMFNQSRYSKCFNYLFIRK